MGNRNRYDNYPKACQGWGHRKFIDNGRVRVRLIRHIDLSITRQTLN